MLTARRCLNAPDTGRRRALVAVLAVLLLAAPATAAPAPAAVRDVRLTDGLTVTWTGVKGLRLHVPTTVHLPRHGARLTVRGGTYAIVRYARAAVCDGQPCPVIGFLDHHARVPYPGAPGLDHLAAIGDGGFKGAYDLYLFTDGEATLAFDGTDAPRQRQRVRPARRVRGGVLELPLTCPAGCTTERLRAGGIEVDVGASGATFASVAIHEDAPSVVPAGLPTPQSHPMRVCLYPWGPEGQASPHAADHPLGCDATTGTTGDAYRDAAGVGSLTLSGGPNSGFSARTDADNYASGLRYLGFQAGTAHDLTAPDVFAYGVWLTYGLG
jgi:hypothetical protein